jgi:hypothetical protein
MKYINKGRDWNPASLYCSADQRVVQVAVQFFFTAKLPSGKEPFPPGL